MFRLYTSTENGPCLRFGRTYKSFKACVKAAIALSRNFSWIEIQNDHLPIARRLLAVVREGQVVGQVPFGA
jgi:hypothetical protein